MYCHFRLMWNPDFDVDAAISEQTRLLYGPAAPYMQKILDEITAVWESPATVNIPSVFDIGAYQCGRISKEMLYDKILTPQMVDDWKKLLLAAEQAVPADSVYRRRIDFSSQPLKLFFVDYDLYKQGFKSESAKVVKAQSIPKIDGKLDDDAWKNAPEYHFVTALLSHVREPSVPTSVKMMYNDRGLFLGLTMTEPNLPQVVIAKPVYLGDSVELFLEFQPGRIYQFIVDSEGKIHDAFLGGFPKRRVDAPVWQVTKGNNVWTLEIYIPFSTLDADMKFSADQPWRANFCRNRVIQGQPVEHSRWQTRFSRSHSDSNAFGKLIFEK